MPAIVGESGCGRLAAALAIITLLPCDPVCRGDARQGLTREAAQFGAMAHALIDTRPLARSGLEVPRIMLGCGNFGGVGSAPEFFGQGIDENGAFALMDAAWELGLRHFDTADAYGGGRSEAMIGRWCAARGLRPAITTKTFNPMAAGADRGLAPERIERQLAASLDRLGTDRVDLYLAHEYDPDVALDDTIGAFEAARAKGSIGAYG